MTRPFPVALAPAVVLFIWLTVPSSSPAAPPPDRPWIDQVERDRDRGAGRIVDEQTWETQRIQEDRDVRLGRLRPRREFDRLDEERDRRLQLDARARGEPGVVLGPTGGRGSVILGRPPEAPGAVVSPMASQAAADERALAEAKDKLDYSLRAVDVAEQRALRTLRRRLTREGRRGEFEAQAGPVREQYQRLRAGHQADYENTRSRILGRPPSTDAPAGH
jgi:hypothetical protein